MSVTQAEFETKLDTEVKAVLDGIGWNDPTSGTLFNTGWELSTTGATLTITVNWPTTSYDDNEDVPITCSFELGGVTFYKSFKYSELDHTSPAFEEKVKTWVNASIPDIRNMREGMLAMKVYLDDWFTVSEGSNTFGPDDEDTRDYLRDLGVQEEFTKHDIQS